MFHSQMFGVELYGCGDGFAGQDYVVDGLD